MDSDSSDIKGNRLLGATMAGDLEEVRTFINNGTDVNYSYEDITALDIAVDQGFNPIVQLLLKSGASFDHRKGSNGFTPLMSAADKGYKDIIDSLVKAGADVNIRLEEKWQKEWTALHIAIFNNREAAAECLLKAGADVDCSDSEGNTPLHDVAGRSHLPNIINMVKLLLRYGADTTLKNKQNQSPLELAEQLNSTKVIKLLKQPKDAKRSCYY